MRLAFPSIRQPARVTFGRGSIKAIAKADGLQETVFFVSAQNEVRTAVDAAFEKQGIDFRSLPVCAKPAGEPSLEMIDLGASFLSNRMPRRIVGIGGGSVMDWCRLAWAQQQGLLSAASGGVAFPCGGSRPSFCLVPTTCATGAEAAAVAVYSCGGRKVAAVCDAFVAEQVVLDSQFLEQTAGEDVATSLADTMSHAIESYCSLVPNALAKEAAVSALWLVLEHALNQPDVCRNDRLMEAGYLGGMAATHCSVGVVHAFAHTISRYGLSHAHANAIALKAGMAVNAEAPALQVLAKRVGLADSDALVHAVAPVLDRAIAGRDHRRLISVLSDERHRSDIIAAMNGDVCFRTNPIPLDDRRLGFFLDRVVEDIRQV